MFSEPNNAELQAERLHA
jgi:hypothetical protein